MRSVADTPPAERYLWIRDRIAQVPQAYPQLRKALASPTWASVAIDYCYADLPLPVQYDVVFDFGNSAQHWQQTSVVRYAIFYSHLVDQLDHGHASQVLIEFPDGRRPSIFSELPLNDCGLTMHPGIGLCTQADWPAIRQRLLYHA